MLRQQADALQQPGHPLLCLPAAHHVVYQQRLHDGKTDRQARIERGVGILKDELNIAPQVLQRRPLQLVYPPPGEGDGAALAVHQLQQRAPGGGLAAAGLAYQPQRLAGVKIETDVFHRVHPASNPIEQPAAQIKARDQMLHPQDRRGAGGTVSCGAVSSSPPGSGNFAGSGRSAIAPASAPPPTAPGYRPAAAR